MLAKVHSAALLCLVFTAVAGLWPDAASGQSTNSSDGPDPREIPLPPIKIMVRPLPGVSDLPVRTGLPDVLTMNNGQKITTVKQWKKRREEIKRILEYYAIGEMPPPPGNVKGREVKSQMVLDGKVKYRLVHLSFGPKEKLGLDIGIFTPADSPGPFPAVIDPWGTPPGATPLPTLAHPPGQGHGVDALLPVVPTTESTNGATSSASSTNQPAGRRGPRPGSTDPEAVAGRNQELFRRGYAHVIFNNNDCAEDTTLRNADGSWAFRTTRFYPAYPRYDWGVLAGWAWGVSRIVDYLETDPFVDKTKLIITGVSRTGKSAMIAAAFDDRLAMAAPCVTGGGGIGAYRFSGAGRGGKEGLSEMMKKYPNWFSPHLHEFWGHVDQLPFDEHWFLALVAPRPFIALEGLTDQVSLENAVKQSWLGAQPAYALFGATDRLGVNYANHGHAFTPEDVTAMLDFADAHLRGIKTERRFDQFPSDDIVSEGVFSQHLRGLPAERRLDEFPTNTIAEAVFNVRDSGAVGDGKTKDTAAIQAALDRCAVAGGGTVVVPAGEYLTGSLDVKSRTTLRLEKDATLLGSPDLDDYPIVKGRWEGRWIDVHRALVSAHQANHIAVVGPGTIAGDLTIGGRQMPRRPCVIEPIDCQNVRLEGFTAKQKRMWTIHPTYCQNVEVKNVTIRSIGGNSDGVDVDSCKHVIIEGCDIESGDDCIAIKSGRGMEAVREGRPTEDVLIRDCTFSDDIFACIGVGSETSGGIRGVHIEHCTFKQAKTYAIYIKSRPGRGAFIEEISGNDLDVQNGTNGFLRINLLNSGLQDAEPVLGDAGIPTAKDFRFTNVRVNCGTLVNAVAISPVKPLNGLLLESVTGTCTKGIALANITGADLRGIQVTGFSGPLLGINNVSGQGLEGAVAIPPTKAGPPVVPATGSNTVGRIGGNVPPRDAQ